MSLARRVVPIKQTLALTLVAAAVLILVAANAVFKSKPLPVVVPTPPTAAPSLIAAWTKVPLGLSLRGASLEAVVPFGNGFLAVGNTPTPGPGAAVVWSSPDGLAWTLLAGIADPASRVSAVAQSTDGRTVVAAGVQAERAMAWASGDGIAWRPVELSSPTPGQIVLPEAVAAGDGGFLILGHYEVPTGGSWPAGLDPLTPALWHSSDGRLWTSVSIPEDGIQVKAIAARGAGFIAGGAKRSGAIWVPAIWTSADGRAWSRAVELPAGETGVPDEYLSINALAVGADRMLAVSGRLGHEATGRIWSSSDGTTWKAVADLGSADPRINVVGWTWGGFVAAGLVGEDPSNQTLVVSSSADGASWARLLTTPEPAGQHPTSLAADGARVVLIASGQGVLVGPAPH